MVNERIPGPSPELSLAQAARSDRKSKAADNRMFHRANQ